MTPDVCPNCGTKLKREMLSCPNCPMSFPEDEDPAAAVHPLKQTRYYQFLLPALFFAVLGYAVWMIGMGLLHVGESSSVNDISPMLRESTSTASSAAKPTRAAQEAAQARSETQGDGGAPEPSEEASSGDEEILVAHDAPSAPETRPSGSAAPAAEWRLRGVVYDLVTLRPLSGASVVFVDEQSNRRVPTRTDSTGRYRTVVPPLADRGYSVSISKDGYSSTYLDPATGGVRQMPAEQRRALARGLVQTFTAAPASVAAPDARPFATDFYLAPR